MFYQPFRNQYIENLKTLSGNSMKQIKKITFDPPKDWKRMKKHYFIRRDKEETFSYWNGEEWINLKVKVFYENTKEENAK